MICELVEEARQIAALRQACEVGIGEQRHEREQEDRSEHGDRVGDEPAHKDRDDVRPVGHGGACPRKQIVRVVAQIRDDRAVCDPVAERRIARFGCAGHGETRCESAADIAAARNGRNIVERTQAAIGGEGLEDAEPRRRGTDSAAREGQSDSVTGNRQGTLFGFVRHAGSAGSGSGAARPASSAAATTFAWGKTFSRSSGALPFAACPLAVAGKAGAASAGATSQRAAPGGGRTHSSAARGALLRGPAGEELLAIAPKAIHAGARNTPRARDPRQAITTRRGRRDRLAHRRPPSGQRAFSVLDGGDLGGQQFVVHGDLAPTSGFQSGDFILAIVALAFLQG